MSDLENRRPLKTRSAAWAQGLAKGLGGAGLSPNAISVIGVLFAAAGAWAFLQIGGEDGPGHSFWLLGTLAIQLRLLANMLDGLVAVEGGKKSATGALFNELPDRVEDALLLIAAGYACGMAHLGYGATILAFGTAYIRATGGALGFAQDFVGPMAKQHRMFVLSVGAVAAFALQDTRAMALALAVITAGAAITCIIRTLRIANLLKAAQ